MLEFFIAHWSSILIVLLFAGLCVFLCRKGTTPYVKKMLFYLVTEAERHFGAGTGELKYAAVTTWIYEKLPSIVRFFFTTKQIDKLIEEAVNEMQEYLSKNSKANNIVVLGAQAGSVSVATPTTPTN